MLWFTGSVQEAVAQAKAKKVIFLVYVSDDDDEQSNSMTETFNSAEVSKKLSDIGCVAIQLKKNSDVCKQFSQIYPVVVVPSTYFIGVNGVPLEIIGGNVSPEEFIGKVESVLKLQADGGSASASSIPETSGEARVLPVGSAMSSSGDLASSSASSLDDRLERAQDLIEMKRDKKAREEIEEEKRKEVERRKLGQDLLKFQQKQKESEAKALADDIAKERAEEKAAREKVKAQIAQDRAERAARFQQERSEQEQVRQEQLQAVAHAQQERAQADAAARSDFARLQFRFPDGSSVTQQFPADEPLSAVREFLRKSGQPNLRAFSLSTTFPRREFSDEDNTRTLRELQLAPCAAMLVLPVQQSVIPTAPSAGAISNFVWSLFTPFFTVLSFLRTLLFGPPVSAQSSTTTAASAAAAAAGMQREGSSSKPADTDPQPPPRPVNRPDRPQSAYKRRGPNAAGIFSRQDGNIHRINRSADDEDENNTWNGNSTQQM